MVFCAVLLMLMLNFPAWGTNWLTWKGRNMKEKSNNKSGLEVLLSTQWSTVSWISFQKSHYNLFFSISGHTQSHVKTSVRVKVGFILEMQKAIQNMNTNLHSSDSVLDMALCHLLHFPPPPPTWKQLLELNWHSNLLKRVYQISCWPLSVQLSYHITTKQT